MKYTQLLYLSADFPNLSNSIWNVLFQGLISFEWFMDDVLFDYDHWSVTETDNNNWIQ